MATDKPRFSITVSDDIYQQINEYQHEHRLATQTKAVLAFIQKGLEVVQKEKKSPTGIIEVEPFQACHEGLELLPIEQDHIKKYRLLDPYGKEAVDSILDVEYRRCTEKPQEASGKIDISAELASYEAELKLQEQVGDESSVSDGQSGIGKAKMA